jgi:acyl carrier protein
MKPVTNLRLLSVITLASSSLFFSACEKKAAESTEAVEVEQAVDTLDSLTDELVVQLNQYADIVLAVKDTATAQEAVTNLNTVADAIAAIAARLDKIEIPDEAANIAVDEKMKTASMAIKQKMQAAGEIMSNEEVAGILIPALQNFGKRMAEQEKVFMRFGSQKNKAPQQQPAPAATPAAAPASEAPAAETPAAPAAEAAAPATPAPAAE